MGRKVSVVTERRRARRAARDVCKAEGKRVKAWAPAERKRVAGLIVQMRASGQQQVAQLRAQTAELIKLERDQLGKRIRDARAAARLGQCVDLTAGPMLRMYGPKRPPKGFRPPPKGSRAANPDAYDRRSRELVSEAREAQRSAAAHAKEVAAGTAYDPRYPDRKPLPFAVGTMVVSTDGHRGEIVGWDAMYPDRLVLRSGRREFYAEDRGLKRAAPPFKAKPPFVGPDPRITPSVAPQWPPAVPRRSLPAPPDPDGARQARAARLYQAKLDRDTARAVRLGHEVPTAKRSSAAPPKKKSLAPPVSKPKSAAARVKQLKREAAAALRAERGQYRARQVGNPHVPPPDVSREAATNHATLYAGRYGMTMAVEKKGPGKAWTEIERYAPKGKSSTQAIKVASPGATNYEQTDPKLAKSIREGDRERAREAKGETRSSAPSDADATWARKVVAIARKPAVAKYHDDRAFIASVYDHAPASLRRGTLEQFKSALIEAHRKRLLRLSRADLVQAMDGTMVERSQAHYLSAQFHFIAI